MSPNDSIPRPLRLSGCSYDYIQQRLKKNATLLLPVGSLEPVGKDLAIGAVNRCCESVAESLSIKLGIFLAPMLPYADNTQFKSFEGCAGIHFTTLEKVFLELFGSWFFQGFKRIIVITFAMDGKKGIDKAIKRITPRYDNSNAIILFSLQDEQFFRSFCASKFHGKHFGRSEWGIHALVSYLCPDMRMTNRSCESKKELPDERLFTRWHKCGRDPEQLRKMVPDGSLSNRFEIPGPEAGQELFEQILQEISQKIAPLPIGNSNAS